MNRQIGIVGLGYVGLPVALAFSRRYPGTIGFDINEEKCEQLRANTDVTGESSTQELEAADLIISSDTAVLDKVDFYVVAVPTPIDESKRPDLTALRAATRTVGKSLRKGDIVVYESTVYPGATEDVCGPILEEVSGLKCGEDFTLGYSPERINPGDQEHTLQKVVKVVSGQDEATLDIVASLYGGIVDAGVHRAASIRVAEASKVIENVQRDLNIALMNELALIFDRLKLDTRAVLAASSTKWNFLPFFPGLVGGHCIGVDPYYLTSKAIEVGINPQVILAGRRINDGMGEFVARTAVRELALSGVPIRGARVGVLGLTFKENVRDCRNSRVPDIIAELEAHGATVLVHDPVALPEEAHDEYGIELRDVTELDDLAALIFAVPHAGLAQTALEIANRPTRVVLDVRGKLDRDALPDDTRYWRL